MKRKTEKKKLNEKGQGMLEYVMLLAVVAAIVLAFKGKITGYINGLTDKVGNSADQVVGQ